MNLEWRNFSNKVEQNRIDKVFLEVQKTLSYAEYELSETHLKHKNIFKTWFGVRKGKDDRQPVRNNIQKMADGLKSSIIEIFKGTKGTFFENVPNYCQGNVAFGLNIREALMKEKELTEKKHNFEAWKNKRIRAAPVSYEAWNILKKEKNMPRPNPLFFYARSFLP